MSDEVQVKFEAAFGSRIGVAIGLSVDKVMTSLAACLSVLGYAFTGERHMLTHRPGRTSGTGTSVTATLIALLVWCFFLVAADVGVVLSVWLLAVPIGVVVLRLVTLSRRYRSLSNDSFEHVVFGSAAKSWFLLVWSAAGFAGLIAMRLLLGWYAAATADTDNEKNLWLALVVAFHQVAIVLFGMGVLALAARSGTLDESRYRYEEWGFDSPKTVGRNSSESREAQSSADNLA